MSYAPVSLKAANTLSAYRIVKLNGANAVSVTDTTTNVPVGVSQDEALAASQGVPVAVSGVARLYCNDTIAAGGLIMTNAAGQGVPAVATTAGVYVIGVCLDTVSATGTIARVLVNPFQLQVP